MTLADLWLLRLRHSRASDACWLCSKGAVLVACQRSFPAACGALAAHLACMNVSCRVAGYTACSAELS